jgi:hypothetical protein
MSSFYVIGILSVIGVILLAINTTGLQQHGFAKSPKDVDTCKAYKELVKIVKVAGLLAVATDDEDKMSSLVDDFRKYAMMILELPPPDKGKC